jgi:hypothetical protein
VKKERETKVPLTPRIWNIEEHKQEDIKTNGDCCFNHIIGLPTKEGMEKPMFDYEKILYDSFWLMTAAMF